MHASHRRLGTQQASASLRSSTNIRAGVPAGAVSYLAAEKYDGNYFTYGQTGATSKQPQSNLKEREKERERMDAHSNTRTPSDQHGNTAATQQHTNKPTGRAAHLLQLFHVDVRHSLPPYPLKRHRRGGIGLQASKKARM